MKQYEALDQEEDSVQLENRFKVTVEFVVKADCIDEAETEINDLIKEGIITIMDNEEREPIYSYDIVEVESAELF